MFHPILSVSFRNERGKKTFHSLPISIQNIQCCPHMETSQLICTANQLTDFYMRATLAINGSMWKRDTITKKNQKCASNMTYLLGCYHFSTKNLSFSGRSFIASICELKHGSSTLSQVQKLQVKHQLKKLNVVKVTKNQAKQESFPHKYL